MPAPVVMGLLSIGTKLIEKLIPDPQKKLEATQRLLELEQAGELKELDTAMQIIVAEAKSEHVITATWRPVTMLVFTAIVANNFILYPYLSLFWTDAPVLDLPDQMWNLLAIGIGGYTVGRSAEKVVKNWKSG